MNNDKPWIFFANCIPVKGATRSVICDLQRGTSELIPNSLFDLLKKYEGQPIKKIKKKYANTNHEIIDQYFNFLVEKEYIFFTSIKMQFPRLSMSFDIPELINNAILDIGKVKHPYKKIMDELEFLGCKYLQIRAFKKLTILEVEEILNCLEGKSIMFVELMTKYNEELSIAAIRVLIDKFPRICKVIVHSASQDSIVYYSNEGMKPIQFIKQNITSSLHCGIVSKNYFATNIPTFTESTNYNTCLNRKISIDQNGEIKNCPSMAKSYGNINKNSLKNVLRKKGFNAMWNISKDQISICKDCEFRHICTDCRAYLQNPQDIFSKPLKCGYSPYTNEWENWSTNFLSKIGIEYYGMQELIKKENA